MHGQFKTWQNCVVKALDQDHMSNRIMVRAQPTTRRVGPLLSSSDKHKCCPRTNRVCVRQVLEGLRSAADELPMDMSTCELMETLEEALKTYCICNGKDDDTFMIGCDHCDDWFHGLSAAPRVLPHTQARVAHPCTPERRTAHTHDRGLCAAVWRMTEGLCVSWQGGA